MISEAELRRQAARWRVDPMVVNLDYSLGWFLAALYSTGKEAEQLRFKGGTCLRKCYLADYRFSEDLDFTAAAFVAPDTLMAWVERATNWAIEHAGPDFETAPARLEVIEDEYGSESYQVRIYFQGPLRWSGPPQAIRLDVTRDERLLLPASPRHLIHPYSDAETLETTPIACYALAEILAEKLRAVGGQRRFAVSRDLYDVHHLIQAGISVAEVVPLLPDKFAARGVAMDTLTMEHLLNRRAEFEADWERRLRYLVPVRQAVSFESAWQSTAEAIRFAQGELR
jgi:predicted nucleotidyltransferase component of viral defense system